MAGARVTYRSVTKRYGEFQALSDFGLEVQPGEFMTFLGPSGSGKTTALNVLAGFIAPTQGEVLINGNSIVALPPEKRQIGMVFQGYTLFPHMSVFDNVAFPLRLRRYSKPEIHERVMAVLKMVRLADFVERMPKELSGGQRQRVAFARAVVFEPPVLLMDEPLGALDLKLREAMQLEIKRYHAQLGCTIVFVTHDQGEALVMSDRIAVMNAGAIEQVDTPARIYDYPSTKYVAEFIGKTNIFTAHRDNGSGATRFKELDACIPSQFSVHVSEGLFSLRPEKIRRITRSEAEDEWITFDVTINEVHFFGSHVEYVAKTSFGSQVLFQETRASETEPMSDGQEVRVGFRFGDALNVSHATSQPPPRGLASEPSHPSKPGGYNE